MCVATTDNQIDNVCRCVCVSHQVDTERQMQTSIEHVAAGAYTMVCEWLKIQNWFLIAFSLRSVSVRHVPFVLHTMDECIDCYVFT